MSEKEDSKTMVRGKPGTLVLLLLISVFTLLTNFLKEQSAQNVQVYLSLRNNLWSYYGTKSIKSKLYELEKNNFAFYTKNIENPEIKNVSKTLMANLEHEIARYKKEKTDIQDDALTTDTNYELAKRQYLMYLVSFSIAMAALLLLVCSILTITDSLALIKTASVVLTLISAGFTAYGIWLI